MQKKKVVPKGPLARTRLSAHRTLVFAAMMLAVLGAYALLSQRIQSDLLPQLAQSVLDQAMNAEVDSLGRITLTPDGVLVLHKPRLSTVHKNQRRLLFEADAIGFALEGRAWSILTQGLAGVRDFKIRRVEFQSPHLYFIQEPDGAWNVDAAFKPKPNPQPMQPTAPAPTTPPAQAPADSFPPEGVYARNVSLHVIFYAPQDDRLEWVLEDLNLHLSKSPGGPLLFRDPAGASGLTARFYGGHLLAHIDLLGGAHGIEGELRIDVQGARVEQLMQDVRMQRAVNGEFNCYLTLTRSFSQTEGRVVGSGKAEVRQGNLFRFPMLLSALSVFGLGDPTANTVDEAQLSFNVRRHHIEITQMDFLSPSTRFFGAGVCDLFGKNLYVVLVPRASGGLLNPANLLLSAFATAVLKGDIANPQAEHAFLPSVRGTERRIIEDALQREKK